ncbi:MAG: ATP-dependent Clp protease ATP-binding subunit [Clostridia bacterium]|nr:ATP-dependent Clp protease ATP-binding subunit [Clostridia bacterium]
MRLCSKCKKRPAVVFMSNPLNPSAEPEGLCLVCAKELGIKPVDDMLKSMNITDEDIEQMSDQFMEMMAPESDGEDGADDEAMNDETFNMGTTPAIPFLKNLFGAQKQSGEEKEQNAKGEEKPKKKRKRFLEQYCTNLTARAKEGKLDNIVGREKELYRTIQILSRRSKNNPCLIGEPGVGKTAIAEGLAQRIANGQAPARLLDKEIQLLDLTALVAGTQFRGQFESRVKGLLEEVKEAGNVILFIDEVHTLVGAGDHVENSMNAANMFKPALSRGDIQIIGATTFKEYRKHIESDAALERRFQPVIIEEPSVEDAISVLMGVKSYYEGYHGVKVPDSIVGKAVKLSERYVTDRYLPDKAIDLLDEACACTSLENKAVDKLYITNKKIAEAQKSLDELTADPQNTDYEKQAMLKVEIENYKKTASGLYDAAADNTVTEKQLAKVIELWTGIPASKVEESELSKLSGLEDRLNEKVIGQKEATKLVAAAVKRSRVHTSALHRPASFIFVGPTGVGKTELVKVLAEQLFSTPETLIRFDMSEFMEKHSVSRLIGAPPGYVGYDEAGQLTEKVRRKPYSVILLDEIEKAHPDVLNILLQILDEGRVTDAQGRTVNFENTVIVMTSNAGSDKSINLMGFGQTAAKASRDKAEKALREFLRPEFIARVDEVVIFEPLSEESLKKIAVLMLDELKTSLAERHIDFKYGDSVCDFVVENANTDRTGARELRNVIRRNIEDKIVDLIVEREDNVIGISATVNKGGIKIDAL